MYVELTTLLCLKAMIVKGYLSGDPGDIDVMPRVVVEDDGVRLDGRIEKAGAQLGSQRYSAILQGQQEIILLIAY